MPESHPKIEANFSEFSSTAHSLLKKLERHQKIRCFFQTIFEKLKCAVESHEA